MVNENITDCLAGPSQIPIILKSHQPKLLPVHPRRSHPNCPLCPLPLCLPFVTRAPPPSPPPGPHMPECQPNLFCSPPLYSLGFYSVPPFTPQPPFTCHPLSHPSPVSLIPHPSKFYPLLGHNLSPICTPSNPKYLGIRLLLPLRPSLTCQFWPAFLFLHLIIIALFPLLSHPTATFPPFLSSCLLIQWLSSFSPTAQSGEPV